MKIPQLSKKTETKTCHNVTWTDDYSWVHQKNILEVLKDSSKLLPEVRKYLEEENTAYKRWLIKLDEKAGNFVILTPRPHRYYPERDIASQVIGFVDNWGKGHYGLEWYFDEYLQWNNVS